MSSARPLLFSKVDLSGSSSRPPELELASGIAPSLSSSSSSSSSLLRCSCPAKAPGWWLLVLNDLSYRQSYLLLGPRSSRSPSFARRGSEKSLSPSAWLPLTGASELCFHFLSYKLLFSWREEASLDDDQPSPRGRPSFLARNHPYSAVLRPSFFLDAPCTESSSLCACAVQPIDPLWRSINHLTLSLSLPLHLPYSTLLYPNFLHNAWLFPSILLELSLLPLLRVTFSITHRAYQLRII